jgi:lipopolysaccharide/colanic/teichoic acid biosynthesis glycosyltransferase
MAIKEYQLTGTTTQEKPEPVEVNSHIGYEASKRIFDILFSIFFILLGLPFIIVCGLLMKLESPGPMFYAQKRVGKGGRTFTVYKLRSMPKNAEANGPVITYVDGDSRPGRIGVFIRKSKIDELPQFLNVLKGDMSVVGPRPERPYFVDKFSHELPDFSQRHLVKPGITGLAQIREMDSFKIRNKLHFDLFYISHRSFAFDMAVLWSTIWLCFHYLFIGMGFIKNHSNSNNNPDGPQELT